MRTFLSLPVTTVIGRCTLDLPQMTVLDLRKAHDRFLLASPRVTSTDGSYDRSHFVGMRISGRRGGTTER